MTAAAVTDVPVVILKTAAENSGTENVGLLNAVISPPTPETAAKTDKNIDAQKKKYIKNLIALSLSRILKTNCQTSKSTAHPQPFDGYAVLFIRS